MSNLRIGPSTRLNFDPSPPLNTIQAPSTLNPSSHHQVQHDDEEPAQVVVSAGVAKNYITPAGYDRLRAELFELIDVERPKVVDIVHWAASNGDRSENGDYIYGKRRLREIDRRIRFLTQRLEIAVVTDPSAHHGGESVFFGATVTFVTEDSTQKTVTILGVDEADSLKQEVTWVSPIARAMLKSRTGDVVLLKTPQGVEEIEILQVQYPSPTPKKT